MACVLFFLLFLSAVSERARGQAAGSGNEITGITAVVHALCGKQIALLGESPVHSFGETLEFKAKLVRTLVDDCHYNAFFIEAGTYDFIHIEKTLKSGGDVTDAMISAAIGGIWNNEEVQSLVPFLREKAESGSLTLGGLDDQIGAGTYASRRMASDLVLPLQGGERPRCLAVLQKHLSWQYTDAAPYSPADKAKILGCLNEIRDRLSAADKVIVDSLKRDLARDFTEDDPNNHGQEVQWMNDRDRSMYLNFRWLFSQLPPHSKVIVWTATVHLAKELSGIDGFEGRMPTGFYIKHDFGDRAFALGFSAYSGNYAFIHQPIQQLITAPASSLEGNAFAHLTTDTVYLSRQQLAKLGSVPARPLSIAFKTAHWNKVVDGLVIFRKEHAPAWPHH